ncbi:palmitoyltransferase swf1 [Cladophialophora chaetospira]|uniref:Palmitoyltransferase n=1 Tax=Cladophialophora chaetospira TaxID=386627 RepID=A0AA39CHK8_9EURO|nr:palmitoyltransferase swf1 [Cladophialophora chaetospira]
MGIVRTIAIVVLSISFVVFVALFGRLPAFRRTPIAFLHRLLWVYIPNAFGALDERLTGRRVFFVALQFIGEILFIPAAWNRLSFLQLAVLPPLIVAPLWFLYLSNVTSSNITPQNHRAAMVAYPYDFALFHPGYFCSTCHFAKPARSKHCSICKACVQKQDHHCIWINNCVGRNNYIWFNALLVSIATLLFYGSWLGWGLLDQRLQDRLVPPALTRGSLTSKRWSTRLDWGEYFHAWAWAIAVEWRIGAVMMLAMMCIPLSLGFLVYHLYLIWAGMTTNESAKWSDWKEDIADRVVFRAEMKTLRETFPALPEDVEPRERDVRWPAGVRAKWWLVRTRDGEQPRMTVRSRRTENGHAGSNHGKGTREEEVPDERWERVTSIAQVENIYDLGFWDNLVDGLSNRG